MNTNDGAEVSAVSLKHNFDLETFKSSMNKMVGINDSSYQNFYFKRDKVRSLQQYTSEEAADIIRGGSIEAQRQLSYDYYNSNGFYKQIITHYATLLCYYGLLIPNPVLGKSLQEKSLAKRYYSALDFLDKLSLESLCQSIAFKVLIEGTYYGVIQNHDKKDSFSLMSLPGAYCRCRFKDENGEPIVEFDVRYFDKIVNESDRNAALNTYPKIISSYYQRWNKKKEKSSWCRLPTDIGVAFDLFDARPYFISTIPSMIQYSESVETELVRQIEEIKRLVVQKIPHLNDGTLLFEPVEAEEMHAGTVKMLKASNPLVSVLTTYGDVEVPSIKTSDAAANNALQNMLQNTYANAGVSGEIFAATGSSSLETSLDFDTALMMVLGTKISRFLTRVLNYFFSNGSISFKYNILPITCHNNKKFMDNSFKLASSGYSYLMPAIAQGFNQRDLVNIKNLENDVLDLDSILKPLTSAYTQSANSSTETTEGGRPEKEDLEKTEKTIQNIESKDSTGG